MRHRSTKKKQKKREKEMSQFGSLAIIIPAIIAIKSVDMSLPENIFRCRVLFVSVMTTLLSVCAFLYFRIAQRNDQRKVKIPAAGAAASSDGEQEDKVEEISVCEHDQRQALAQLKKFATNVLLIGGIHWYFGVTPPLVIQSLLNPYNFCTSKLFKAHVLGYSTDEGELQRPWVDAKAPSLMSMFGGGGDSEEAESSDENEAEEEPVAAIEDKKDK
jgi:Phosphate transport (Pho88)